MLYQKADELLDIFTNVTECVFVALHGVAEGPLQHHGRGVGEAVFAEVHDDVELVQVEGRNVFGRETSSERDAFSLHHHRGAAGDAGRGRGGAADAEIDSLTESAAKACAAQGDESCYEIPLCTMR